MCVFSDYFPLLTSQNNFHQLEFFPSDATAYGSEVSVTRVAKYMLASLKNIVISSHFQISTLFFAHQKVLTHNFLNAAVE